MNSASVLKSQAVSMQHDFKNAVNVSQAEVVCRRFEVLLGQSTCAPIGLNVEMLDPIGVYIHILSVIVVSMRLVARMTCFEVLCFECLK